MRELRDYYVNRLIMAAGLIILIVEYINPYIELSPLMQSKDSGLLVFAISHIISFLTSRAGVVILIGAASLFIQKYLWKIEKPHLDFSGEWCGKTCYKNVYVGDSHYQARCPFMANHRVKMVQDCLSFRLDPAPGEKFINWSSLALELDCDSTLRYAYKVNYSDTEVFPDSAIGYEEMSVTERGARNRPIVLTGKFWHCAQGKEPVYGGTVEFKRKVKP